jgi:type IV secretory pathway TraG/TraD family ATPase VirD4
MKSPLPLQSYESQPQQQLDIAYLLKNIGSIKLEYWLLVFMIPLYFWARSGSSLRGGGKKLANARWASSSEKKLSQVIGMKMIASGKRSVSSAVVGLPKDLRQKWLNEALGVDQAKEFNKILVPYILQANKTAIKRSKDEKIPRQRRDTNLFIPAANQHTLVMGGSGTGKTFSAIMSMMHSVLLQGHSALWYDFKYPEGASEIIPLAKLLGYEVYIFAPGFKETGSLNPLDFITKPSDETSADSIAKTLIRNLNPGDKGEDPFFGPAGIAVARASFMLAKWVAEEIGDPSLADLLTCSTLLSLSNLPLRIAEKRKKKEINPWVAKAFDQLIVTRGSGKEANVTEAGIMANAIQLFQTLVREELVPSFFKTSIPVVCNGQHPNGKKRKVLYVFGLDQSRREAVAPILAAVMSEVISRNVDHGLHRKDPFFVFIDELPSISLQKIKNWLAEARSAGMAAVLGVQNLAQFSITYQQSFDQVVTSNCATKFFFNPQEVESSKYVSDLLGEEEIKTISRSTTSGKEKSTGRSDSVQKKPLIPSSEVAQLAKGEAIFIGPHVANSKKSNYPQRMRIQLPDWDIAVRLWSQDVWQKIHPQLQLNGEAMALNPDDLEKAMDRRREILEKLLPDPTAEPVIPAGITIRGAIDKCREVGWIISLSSPKQGQIDDVLPLIIPPYGTTLNHIFYSLGKFDERAEISPDKQLPHSAVKFTLATEYINKLSGYCADVPNSSESIDEITIFLEPLKGKTTYMPSIPCLLLAFGKMGIPLNKNGTLINQT